MMERMGGRLTGYRRNKQQKALDVFDAGRKDVEGDGLLGLLGMLDA